VLLPMKRFGYFSAHRAVVSLQRLQSSRSVFGSAHEVPCRTVLEVTTILAGNIGVVAGMLLGQLIMRVGIVIPPRSD